jgi:aminoglycoside 2'-N-acetyltransferase I
LAAAILGRIANDIEPALADAALRLIRTRNSDAHRQVPGQSGGVTAHATRVVMISTEDLSVAQRAAVIEVCVSAHDNDEFTNLFEYVSPGGRHFLAYRGSELVSHAVVTTRWLEPERHRILRTAYVDAVATLPTAQRLGCASAVMRRLAAGVPDYDIACLQTDRPGFFARLGWELWRGDLAGRGDDGLIPTPDQHGVMVLRLARTPPLDLDSQLTIEVQAPRIWE